MAERKKEIDGYDNMVQEQEKREEMGSFKKNFKRGGKSNGGKQPEGMGGDNRIKSVIYVQHTRGSSLA